MTTQFFHLHCHSHYSLLDGLISPTALVEVAKANTMSAVGLTDNGVMFGAIDFYIAAQQAGIKPIVGCELLLTDTIAKKKRGLDRLLCFAISAKGYQTLTRLVSIAHLEGFYYTPRIDWSLLQTHTDDLLVVSHGYQGPVANFIKQHQEDAAINVAKRLHQLFPDRFYLGIQRLGAPQEDMIIEDTKKIGNTLAIPLVATNDVYYTNSDNARLRNIVNCIQTGKRLEDNTRLSLRSKDHYFKSQQDMIQLFHDVPDAIDNTIRIVDQIDLKIDTKRVLLPIFNCPDGLSKNEYLNQLVWQGIKEKYPTISPTIKHRVEYELDIIQKMNYSVYFLIIHDFLMHCYHHNIPVGPGRGSAAGSIIAYALHITQIDPIKYNLLFERFLNPERVSMPDIDIDFCIKRRDEVIDYIIQRYGASHVAQIATFGTMAARGVIRDVGRVLNVPLFDVDRIAKLIPSQPGHYTSITQALEMVPDLKTLYQAQPDIKQLIDLAAQLEGLPRHTSTHAAGIVISRDALADTVPLMKNDNQITTQYPMGDLERIGLLKMDILGLRNLTVIQDALSLIAIQHPDTHLDLQQVPLDDPKTYATLSHGETTGIFQLESHGIRQLIQDMQPTCFEDVVALLALYRPGPLGSGMVNEFLSNKKGTTETQYSVPELEPILKDTYGLILYQEQVMQIASVIGGFSLSEADMLRRAMGKKKKSVMDKLKAQFLTGAINQGIAQNTAESIFNLCYKFSEYGFNKSHSVAYAFISYQTAYLKTHYPAAYMTALLTSVQSDSDKKELYIKECKRLGIPVALPNINTSLTQPCVTPNGIQFGLGSIKNVGEQAIIGIIEERNTHGLYANMVDFLMRIDLRQVNKRVIESLIKSGCFDDWDTRQTLLTRYEQQLEQAQRQSKEQENGQQTLFDTTIMFANDTNQKRYTSITPHTLLAFEKDMLGVYISGHPLDSIAINQSTGLAISAITSDHVNQTVQIIGLLSNCRIIQSKAGKKMGIGSLEDKNTRIDVLLFEKDTRNHLFELFENDTLVTLSGHVRLKENTLSVMITNIATITDTPLQKTLHIDIAPDAYSTAMLDSLRTICHAYPGDTNICFHVGSDQVLAGKSFRIANTPDCLAAIESLVGRAAAWVV